MTVDERLDRAQQRYEQAVFGGDESELAEAERELDSLEADVALARGRIQHARYLGQRRTAGDRPAEDPRELELFTHAAQLYRAAGDVRGEGEAAFWIGCCLQVIRDDDALAVPYFERARSLADQAGDKLSVSYSLRHLAFARLGTSDLDAAQDLMVESTRLRTELGFKRGIAANLVALADIAELRGDRDQALSLVTQAEEVAKDCGAHGMAAIAAQTRERINADVASKAHDAKTQDAHTQNAHAQDAHAQNAEAAGKA
jgi:tetratricopeptide (TPR) repeat protein